VPSDDRLGFHKDERRSPLGPGPREPDPEQAVGRGQMYALSARAFQNVKLVPQGENLNVQRSARPNQRTDRKEYGDDEGHQGSRLCDGDENLNESTRTVFLVGTATRRERFSVHFTNAGLVAALLVAHLTIGLPTLLVIQLPTLLLAGAAGVWLFYVQHQFEDVYWAHREAWEPMRAALEGSSYYKLPKVLQWFTGNIGLHHIHHVQPRIPSYNLQQCQDAIPAFQAVPPLTLRRSLDSLRLRLLDESGRRMVSWVTVNADRGGR
jgi:Fatty acid desaturase